MRPPAIASCPCNTVLTQKGSVSNIAAHSYHHTLPAGTLEMSWGAVVPLHKLQVDMPHYGGSAISEGFGIAWAELD